MDIPDAEREAFEPSREKDRLVGRFVKMGPVAAVVPVRLKHPYEVCSGPAARGAGGGV